MSHSSRNLVSKVKAFLLAVVLTVATGWSTTGDLAHAQQPVDLTQSRPGAICMARPQSRVPQVAKAQQGQLFSILTSELYASAFEAKGYRRVDCGTADLLTTKKREAYRDKMCELAGVGNSSVQRQVERALGEKPAVLCANAEIVAGTWARRSWSRKK